MVTSQPLASRQSRISSSVAYLPVPTISRLWIVCVPIVKGSSAGPASGGLRRAAADQRDDLEDVPGCDAVSAWRRRVTRSRLTSTATYSGFTESAGAVPPRSAARATRGDSPLMVTCTIDPTGPLPRPGVPPAGDADAPVPVP